MKCSNPNCPQSEVDFPEREIQLSHDVPCYIFPGKDRKEKKNQADKYGRRYLCQLCHDIYEKLVFSIMVKDLDDKAKQSMIINAQLFSKSYFKKRGGKHDSI